MQKNERHQKYNHCYNSIISYHNKFLALGKTKKKPSVIPAINKQLEEMEAVKKEEIENRNKMIKDLENQISIIKAKRNNKKPIMRIKTPKEKQELINNLNDKEY